MNLLNYIEEENLDKNNENLKYLNDISSNLLQIFEDKGITSNWRPMSNSLSETVCQLFFFFVFVFCYAGRNKIFSSANLHRFGLLKYFCQK